MARIATKRSTQKKNAGSGLEKVVYERQAQICKAFANPVRLQILELVAKQERQAGELQQILEVSKANLSQHMSILRTSGVVAARREGKQVFYSLALPEVEQACQLVRKVLQAQVEGVRRALG